MICGWFTFGWKAPCPEEPKLLPMDEGGMTGTAAGGGGCGGSPIPS